MPPVNLNSVTHPLLTKTSGGHLSVLPTHSSTPFHLILVPLSPREKVTESWTLKGPGRHSVALAEYPVYDSSERQAFITCLPSSLLTHPPMALLLRNIHCLSPLTPHLYLPALQEFSVVTKSLDFGIRLPGI